MRRRLTALGLFLLLLCTACVPGTAGKGPSEGRVAVWFLARENGELGSALTPEYRSLPEEEGVGPLLSMLFSGPEDPELAGPFPRGAAVKSWRLEGDLLMIDLSEAYGGLSGADLSLADGCIVLTLCQLPEVGRVYLTVEGRPRPFRDLVLRPNDFLLENGTGGERECDVQLWFPGVNGLAPEERTLSLAIGDDPAAAAIQALLAGPESGELRPVCPEGTVLLSLTKEKDRYIVDLSGSWLEGAEDSRHASAIAATLSRWTPEAQVEIWVEGQAIGSK